MTRIQTGDTAFPAWMQSVEDRLRQLRRSIRPQASSLDELAVATLTVGQIQLGDSSHLTGVSGGVIDAGPILQPDQFAPAVTAATTLGSVIGRVALVDTNGTVVGYLPVYDSIT